MDRLMKQQGSMYASMFTLGVFITFGFPLGALCFLANDRDFQYWIGTWPFWCLLWVPVWLIAHVRHLKHGRPKKSLMMACMFLPASTFFLSGWRVMTEATYRDAVLKASDCNRHPDIARLHKSYMDAREFRDECAASPKDGRKMWQIGTLLQYCDGFEKAQEKH